MNTAVNKALDDIARLDDVPEYPLSTIKEYNETELGIAEFRQRYQNLVFNTGTSAGLDEAKKARATLRGLRSNLERKRKELKAPALEYAKSIDSEAKRIEALVESIEDPIDAQIKAREAEVEAAKQAKALAEAERVRGINAKIDTLRFHGGTVRTPLAGLYEIRDELKATVLDINEFQEHLPIAKLTLEASILEVEALIVERDEFDKAQAAQAAEREAVEAERKALQAEIEAERKALEQQAAAQIEATRALEAERAAIKAEREALEEAKKPVVESVATDIKLINEAGEEVTYASYTPGKVPADNMADVAIVQNGADFEVVSTAKPDSAETSRYAHFQPEVKIIDDLMVLVVGLIGIEAAKVCDEYLAGEQYLRLVKA